MDDALSRKEKTRLMSIQLMHLELQKEINKLELELIVGNLANLTIQPTTLDGMKGSQMLNSDVVKIRVDILEGKETPFVLSEDGILHVDGRLCLPNNEDIEKINTI